MIEIKENYIDVTEEWINKENFKKGIVINRNYYIDKECNKYKVDGKNVVLDYSIKEKEVAEWLITKFGGNIYMLPRVNKPDGIMTADYLFKGECWDLKTISGSGKRVIEDVIKKKRMQSNNFILDVTNSKIDKQDLFRQLEKIYNSKTTEWVKTIIVKENDNLVVIYTNSKKD